MRSLPQVLTKLKLPKILLKVLLRNTDVRPGDAALDDGPKRLDIVRVDLAAHVFLGAVVHHLMLVDGASGAERAGLIRHDRGALGHELVEVRRDLEVIVSRDNAGNHVASRSIMPSTIALSSWPMRSLPPMTVWSSSTTPEPPSPPSVWSPST